MWALAGKCKHLRAQIAEFVNSAKNCAPQGRKFAKNCDFARKGEMCAKTAPRKITIFFKDWLLECRAVMLPKRESRWNLQGCPKLANRSQLLVGQSSPYCGDVWRTYCCLKSFYPIVDTCLSCEDTARQSCPMVPKWRFFASCIFSKPRAAHFRHAF